jgi:uncharacterized membrane protein
MQLLVDIEEKVEHASRGFRLSTENVLQVGFNLFRRSPGIFMIYGIIALLVMTFPLSSLLLGGPMLTGFYIAAHLTRNGRQVTLHDFFRSYDKFAPLLILHLLMTLFITLGLLFLVIPGIILAVNYLFAHFFVWFYEIDPYEAMRMSRRTVKGNFGQILLLCLILAGINLIGAFAFGVGLLLTFPFSCCVIYATFDDIIGIP